MFKSKRKGSLFLLSIIILALILGGCNSEPRIGKVNGEVILEEDFKTEYMAIGSSYISQLGEGALNQEWEEGQTLGEKLKEDVLNKLTIQSLIEAEAKKANIKLTDDDFKSKLDETIEMIGGEDTYKQFLEYNGMTEEYFEKDFRKALLMEEYQRYYIDKLDITEEEGKEYFEENKDEFISIKASHILVEELGEAEDIKKQLDDGAKFEELAKEKSLDVASGEVGGDLGYFQKDTMIPEFSEAAFSMEEGEISNPVETDIGYHIIYVEEIKDDYESLEVEIMEKLMEDKYEEHILELEKEATIEFDKDKIEEIVEESIKELETEMDKIQDEDIEESEEESEESEEESKESEEEKDGE